MDSTHSTQLTVPQDQSCEIVYPPWAIQDTDLYSNSPALQEHLKYATPTIDPWQLHLPSANGPDYSLGSPSPEESFYLSFLPPPSFLPDSPQNDPSGCSSKPQKPRTQAEKLKLQVPAFEKVSSGPEHRRKKITVSQSSSRSVKLKSQAKRRKPTVKQILRRIASIAEKQQGKD